MFGLGMGHMLLLAAIALIAIGPKQLPEVARMIGRFLSDMKRVRDEFTRTITETRDNVNENYQAPYQPPPQTNPYDSYQQPFQQSSFTPPPFQIDVAAQHAAAAVEDRNLAENAEHVGPALDEHNQIAFDLTSTDDSSAHGTKKDQK